MSSTFLCTSWPFLYLSWKYIYKYLFKNCYFFSLSHMSSLYILDIIRYIVGKCFLLSHRLSSHFVKFSSQYRSFYFRYSPTYLFLLLLPCTLCVRSKKIIGRPTPRNLFPMLSSMFYSFRIYICVCVCIYIDGEAW